MTAQPGTRRYAMWVCALMMRNQGPCELVDGQWVYERTLREEAAKLLAAGHFTTSAAPIREDS